MLSRIKFKAFTVFSLMHIGLGFLLYSLFRMSDLRNTNPQLFYSVLTGTCALYGAFVLGGFFVYLPVAPWINRFGKVREWRLHALDALPTILALIPVVAGIIAILRAGAHEISKMNKKGELDWDHFRKLAQKYSSKLHEKYSDFAHPRVAKAPVRMHPKARRTGKSHYRKAA